MAKHHDISETFGKIVISNAYTPKVKANEGFPAVMTINVGGRRFVTTPDTLCAESRLFRKQLSPQFTWTPQEDGSYFMNSDPELFEHLLRFMRRPSVFPLFYDQSKGFDYDLYNRLEVEAEYYQIDMLHLWIQGERYLEAIRKTTYPPKTYELGDLVSQSFRAQDRGTTREVCNTKTLHFIPYTEKTYVCPRAMRQHRGNPQMCGAQCRKAQGNDDDQYEDENCVKVVSVEKDILFDRTSCRSE